MSSLLGFAKGKSKKEKHAEADARVLEANELKAEAEEKLAKAEKDAADMVQQAKQRAERLVEDARAQAKDMLLQSQKPAMKGYLHKFVELGSAQKRWFVLRGTILVYYIWHSSPEPKGCILLEGCTLQREPADWALGGEFETLTEEDLSAKKDSVAGATDEEAQAADETKGLAEPSSKAVEAQPGSTSTLRGILGLQLQKGGLLDFFGNNDLRLVDYYLQAMVLFCDLTERDRGSCRFSVERRTTRLNRPRQHAILLHTDPPVGQILSALCGI